MYSAGSHQNVETDSITQHLPGLLCSSPSIRSPCLSPDTFKRLQLARKICLLEWEKLWEGKHSEEVFLWLLIRMKRRTIQLHMAPKYIGTLEAELPDSLFVLDTSGDC